MSRPMMTLWQARAVADEIDPPVERLHAAREALAGARRRGPDGGRALERLDAQLALRGVLAGQVAQEAA